MLYHYTASNKEGKIVEGELDADDLKHALHLLNSRELYPVSVKPLRAARTSLMGSPNISLTDKIFLMKYLSLMLKVGTDLLSAINILIFDFEKPAVRNFLLEVRENLTRGQPFSRAFEAHPNMFSRTVVSLIKAAEVSGNLQKTFEELSVSLEAESQLKGKIRAALIYPIILTVISLVIILFLVTTAVPKVAKVFSDSGVQPPLFSRIVFAVGLFFGDHLLLIAGSVLFFIALSLWLYYKTALGKQLFNQFLKSLPIVKNVYRDVAIQRIASTMSSLLKAGLPIVECITIAADSVGQSDFKSSLERIANEGLSKGLTVGEAFKREPVFPRTISNLIAISEKAGHLDEVLSTLSDFYSANIDSAVKSIVSLLEPALLVVMGVVVAGIALSIILPIYQLTTQF